MKIKLYVAMVALSFLAMSGLVIAADVTTQGTPNNVAPAIAEILVNDSTPAPGVAFTVSAVVNDDNGVADIYNSNITCYASTGTEGTDGWDSIKLLNSSVSWTSLNTSAITINGTFTSSVNYWSSKSIGGTWTCKVYANDSSGASTMLSTTMTVENSTGITLGDSTCVFDAANPGTNDQQWKCPAAGTRNQTITHNGNIDLNITISGTDLTGQTDSSWVITVGNITWNQTTSAVPTTEAGTALSGSAVDFITLWNRGTLSTRTYNATNLTAWLDYPTPLKSQLYQGTITLTSSVA